jgi:D-alanyl-D-alanine carboxypeptidase/D-alanyl-D-alanine-endopeptidase (penicillin-binding protein 4)
MVGENCSGRACSGRASARPTGARKVGRYPRWAVFLIVSFAGRAWAGPPPAELQEQLSALLAKVPKGTRVSLAVAEAATGAQWFAYEADTPLEPASVQKLFVTAAALERFGPKFKFETRAYLRGDELWVVGSGDPGLGDQRLAERHGEPMDGLLDEWAAALRSRGATSLSKVVLDDTVFDAEIRHPDWPDSQEDRWYQAPVGGLNLNDNCLDVTVAVRGRAVELRLQPDVGPGLVHSTLTRGKKQRPVLKRPAGSDVFQLSGTVATGGPLDPVAVNDPTIFFAHALQRALEKHGVTIQGDIVRRQLRESDLAQATLLGTHTTDLADVLWRCNTFSQNLFAECLLKSLAAYEPDGRRSGVAGSFERGQAISRAVLDHLGIGLSGAELHDGSGLSHQNRATASQFVELLVRMRRHPQAEVFLESLARAGEVGSMQHRYSDPLLRGRLRGKTGTLAGVHTLAGYLTRPDNTVLAFALLINGKTSPDLPLQICRTLVTAK